MSATPADLRAAIVARWVAELADTEAAHAPGRLERVVMQLEARRARRWAARRLGFRRFQRLDRQLGYVARRVWLWGW